MTHDPAAPASIMEQAAARNAALLRRCSVVMVVAGVACVVVAASVQGAVGFWGAVIGVVLVLAFFGVDLLVLRATRYTPPIQVLAVVAMVYLLKITLLAVFLVTLRGTALFSVRAFGATVILLTLVALGAAVILVAKREVLLVDPAVEDETGVGLEAAGEPGSNGPDAQPPASVES